MATGTAPYSQLSTISLFNNSTPYFSPNLRSGINSGLTWTATGSNSTYIATIPVSGVTANSIVQATIAQTPAGGDFTDAINCWLVSSYTGTNAINIIVAGNPTAPARFPIAWQIIKE